MAKKIHFIINPASGKPYPMLYTINEVCAKYQCEWTVAVTRQDTIARLSQEAAQSDADIVAVYGGDGTIAAVAGEVHQTDKMLGILPGGTGNVLANELNISKDIRHACERICLPDPLVRKIDVGKIGEKYFLMRVGLGFEAELIKGADRTSKKKMGWIAYVISGVRAVFKTRLTHYRMILDGEKVSCKGISLVIANSATLGLNLFSEIDISDGMLDVILIRPADVNFLFSQKKNGSTEQNALSFFQHWSAKEIIIEAGYNQPVQYDGEVLEMDRLKIEVVPQSLKVIC